MNTEHVDLGDIIHEKRLFSVYQPLVSMRKKAVFGFEALTRGQTTDTKSPPISPNTLFAMAREQNKLLDLDRLCREKAFAGFAPIHKKNRDQLLSINLETSVIDRPIVGNGYLRSQVARNGINPNNIIIEIIESRIKDSKALEQFVRIYRGFGFLIALDDIGSGSSNLDRVSQLKPDVIKIDRGLISGIDHEYYKFEVTKSLVRLARSIGSMIVAEGVERIEEVIVLMELGVDLFQGFYFSEPLADPLESAGIGAKIDTAAKVFKDYVVKKLNSKKRLHQSYDRLLSKIVGNITGTMSESFDCVLAEAFSISPDLECLYVLDRSGRQISSSVCNPDRVSECRRIVFEPAPAGADHSLKEYFLPLDAGLKKFTTEPYISLASGTLCTTISTVFECGEGKECILCMDITSNDRWVQGIGSHDAGQPMVLDDVDGADSGGDASGSLEAGIPANREPGPD